MYFNGSIGYDWYSRDISKKVRAMVHQKGNSGQSITSKLPYGYTNSPENKSIWVIDEVAANVVRKIFDLYLNQSYGVYEIAKILEEEEILIPHYHRLHSQGKKFESQNPYRWNGSVVRYILLHQEYVGDTVNFRSTIKSYKDKTKVWNDSDEIKVFPDTHPAIIDRETFERVQDKYQKTVRHTKNKHNYIFSDFLYCMDCHGRMHGKQSQSRGNSVQPAYECATYRKGKGCCFHGVPEVYLYKEVLAKIQSVLEFAKVNPTVFRKKFR